MDSEFIAKPGESMADELRSIVMDNSSRDSVYVDNMMFYEFYFITGLDFS